MKAEKFDLGNFLNNSKDLSSSTEPLVQGLQNLSGVNAARVDPFANTITVDYDNNEISSSEIKQKLDSFK